MGLGAEVRCTCWEQGRTRPPPCDPRLVVIDADGALSLNLPWEGNEAAHDALYTWQDEACTHPHMSFANEHIANWSGYRLFQQALADVGWTNFPTLRAVLPNSNGGLVSPGESVRCLDELEIFEASSYGDRVVLVDEVSGEERAHVAAYEGVFILDGRSGLDLGFDAGGLFVREAASKRELFRAMRVEQQPRLVEGREGALLRDRESAASLVIPFRIHGAPVPWDAGRMEDDSGQMRFATPQNLSVQRRTPMHSDFEYILVPLRAVFRASIATGNPVRWT